AGGTIIASNVFGKSGFRNRSRTTPMRTTNMRIALWGILLSWAWLGVVDDVFAQVGDGNTSTIATRRDPSQAPVRASPHPRARLTDRPGDERALQAVAAAFSRSYAAGDARALASLFTDDAEMIDENGGRLRGRPAIEGVFGSMFRQRPGAT